jgi:hypothetical protein
MGTEWNSNRPIDPQATHERRRLDRTWTPDEDASDYLWDLYEQRETFDNETPDVTQLAMPVDDVRRIGNYSIGYCVVCATPVWASGPVNVGRMVGGFAVHDRCHDDGPGTPCPHCDSASFVDDDGCCIYCGEARGFTSWTIDSRTMDADERYAALFDGWVA